MILWNKRTKMLVVTVIMLVILMISARALNRFRSSA